MRESCVLASTIPGKLNYLFIKLESDNSLFKEDFIFKKHSNEVLIHATGKNLKNK